MGLSGTHKTNITSIETDITTAINSLNPTADNTQRGAVEVLSQMRRLLARLTVERNQ